jgi:haloalkane dehalogenase
VLWGQQDEYFQRDFAPRFVTEIPGAQLVTLEHARHFVFEDDPERCAEEVIGFLERASL